MNKYEKEILQSQLDMELDELKKLKAIYMQAAKDIKKKIELHDEKIKILLENIDDLDDVQRSILQAQIYQKKYQKQLKQQIQGILNDLNSKQYKNVEEYLKSCYKSGVSATAYSLHKQGIPLVLPIDQKAVYAASKLEAKISKRLYGEYTEQLKRDIRSEISRGFAASSSYSEIARNIDNRTNVGFNKAMRIARTEGGKIRNAAEYSVALEAKKVGADIVLQWSAALDKRTRPSHARVDGEIVELGKKFSNGLLHPCDPSGTAAEVINCRCAAMQRARWALDEDELQTLKDRAAYYGLDKTQNFEDFKQKYLKIPSKALTTAEQKAIYDYMSAKSYVVNDKLRNNVDLTPEEVEFTVYLDLALDKMPRYKGNLQRSVYLGSKSATDDFMKAYAIGKIIIYDEYISTTKGAVYNPDADVQIYIVDAESGADISEWNGGEQEVLYKRGSSFMVLDIQEREGVQYILLGEVDE